MCGLIVEFSPKREFASNFGEMLDEMAHRGRSHRSIHEYSTCKVGFRRLAITDIKTSQPGVALVFKENRLPFEWEVFINGEVYNYKDLGFQGSECEVLAQGFAKFGCDFVKRLNGMFCIVAIQGENVYVFRDRFGVKPLYWWENGDSIVISSEIKPITRHPEYKFAINEAAKTQWLTFNNVFTDDTLFQGIRKVEKGTYWNLNTGKVAKYWEWNFTEEPIEYEEAKIEIRRLVMQSVERQTPKEVPFGACLSGGIDSNIISAILGKDAQTFTVGFTDGVDERHLVDLAKTDNYQIIYSRVRHLRECIYHLEDLRVGASFTNYGLFQLASKFVKVVFDGGGSDEIFNSYQWRYDAPDYYSVVNRTGIQSDYCRQIFDQAFFEDTLAERFKFDADYFLEGVNIVTDRMSMSATVECRLPFLDNLLVDFVVTIPFEFKKNKRILRDAFSDLLHPEVLAAPKMGFSSPDWFTGNGNKAKKWSEKALETWMELFNFER